MADIPAKYMDLFKDKKAFAGLATVMPDGSPQVTPVWFDFDGTHVRVNTAKGRVKARNMEQGSKVALSIMDPDNPYRYVQVRGTVERATEEGASEHIDALTKKYMGQDKYPYHQPGDVRVLYDITPDSVSGMG